MNVTFTHEELEFRAEVRAFFKTEFPQDILEKKNRAIPLTRDDIVRWHKLTYKKGWGAPSWPEEYGGTGWSSVQKYIFANDYGFDTRHQCATKGRLVNGPDRWQDSGRTCLRRTLGWLRAQRCCDNRLA